MTLMYFFILISFLHRFACVFKQIVELMGIHIVISTTSLSKIVIFGMRLIGTNFSAFDVSYLHLIHVYLFSHITFLYEASTTENKS